MLRVSVAASGSYDVLIERGLLTKTGSLAAKAVCGRCAALISDDCVSALYGAVVERSLRSAGFSVFSFRFLQGETSKNVTTYFEILNFLAENGLRREDCIIALGGGVTGDLAGFAAATYLRGIAYLQIPTTLLAMVDSSVGGKTAIDLPAGKNLAGAFWQPALVLCDPDVLSTLPPAVFSCGCAEIAKYGVLLGEPFFSQLESGLLETDPVSVIAACVQAKRQYVQADEFDRDTRHLLNLGHTFGHALESASGYALSHGQAVACGLAMICRAAQAFGFCDAALTERVIALLRKFSMPTETALSAQVLSEIVLRDKKRCADALTLIVPTALGRCVPLSVSLSEIPAWLLAGGAK